MGMNASVPNEFIAEYQCSLDFFTVTWMTEGLSRGPTFPFRYKQLYAPQIT